MKIIFLDIDGVLNTNSNLWETRRIRFKGKRRIPTNKKPKRVFAKLVSWMIENEIYFVMSTSWRVNTIPKDWNEILKNYGIKKDLVFSITPFHKENIRGIEIKDWLRMSNEKIEDYVIIDDEIKDILPYIENSHIIHINANNGITEDDFNKIKLHFKNKKKNY